jgi:hypothetical protein
MTIWSSRNRPAPIDTRSAISLAREAACAMTDSSAKSVTEEEYVEMVDRLDATRQDVFCQRRELRALLSHLEDENRALHSRIAELEGIMRRFAPILLNAATAIESAATNERGA